MNFHRTQKYKPFGLIHIVWLLCVIATANGTTQHTPAVTRNLKYTVQILGIDSAPLKKNLESVSKLIRWQDRPPESQIRLEQRVQSDLDKMRLLLRSEGYYSASLDYRIDSKQTPLKVALTVDTGPLYVLRDFRVLYQGVDSDSLGLPWRDSNYPLTKDQAARAQFVIDARNKVLDSLTEIGYPNAQLIDQKIIVDHKTTGMTVSLKIEPGQQAYFGKLSIQGAKIVRPDYIRRFVPWHPGDLFDSRKINKFRNDLLLTGMFDTVALEYPKHLDSGDRLPITLSLTERKHRSIELGMRWSTDKGFEGNVAWENRNIFGRQESIAVTAELGQIRQEVDVQFTKPHFLHDKQDLLAYAALAHEDTPAYSGPLSRFSIGLQRPFSDSWSIFGGVPVEYSQLTDTTGTRNFFLWGLEAKVEYDDSNDRFDPSEGTRLKLSLSPSLGSGTKNIGFLTSELTNAVYFDPIGDRSVILASRLKLGSIQGLSTQELPANKRFYAGGGDSIRGYSFQLAGPLSPDDRPLGGRSIFELNTEIRARINDSIGAVIFLDGGNVYDGELPDLFGSQLWAAGIGLRYFTPVGPIRLDFGFPLNRREDVDDVFQFYISVGQAF